MILTAGDYGFRHIKDDDDGLLRELFSDWPEDDRGGMTRRRALNVADKWAKQCKYVERPTRPGMAWNETFVVSHLGIDVGLTRRLVRGKNMQIDQQVIHPDHRGLGHMRNMNAAMIRYIHESLAILRCGFVVMGDNTQVKTFIASRGYDKGEENAPSKTGRQNKRYLFNVPDLHASFMSAPGRVDERAAVEPFNILV